MGPTHRAHEDDSLGFRRLILHEIVLGKARSIDRPNQIDVKDRHQRFDGGPSLALCESERAVFGRSDSCNVLSLHGTAFAKTKGLTSTDHDIVDPSVFLISGGE